MKRVYEFRGETLPDKRRIVGNLKQVNPDRVKAKGIPLGSHTEYPQREYETHRQSGPSLGVGRARGWGMVARAGTIAAALLALNATNLGVERSTPERAEGAVSQTPDFRTDASGSGWRIRFNRLIDQFSRVDADGKREFNPGALLFPAAFSVSTGEVQEQVFTLTIPYEWAYDFQHTELSNPAEAHALEERLISQLAAQIQEQIVMHGIPGATDSPSVWNAQGERYITASDGSLVPQPGVGLSVESISIRGSASDEAQADRPASLGSYDPQNAELALRRANHNERFILEALSRAGFDISHLQNVNISGTENLMNEGQVQRLDHIAESLGISTMDLIMRYNRENLAVSPEDQAFLSSMLNAQRGAVAEVRARGSDGGIHTFNVGFPWPLLALLFIIGRPGRRVPVTHRYTDERRVHTYHRALVARRIFSETDPNDYGIPLDTQRDFDALYDSIDLHAHAADLPGMQQHFLTEEVLPSLKRNTQEPHIDYLKIAAEAFEFMYSDTSVKKFGIRKGRYPTSDEAQRFIAERLIEMWEHHDQAIFPMEERGPERGGMKLTGKPLDLKKQLNYRHVPGVVLWAKLLAEQFTLISEQLYSAKKEAIAASDRPDALPILTRDEFESALRERIAENANAASRDGNRQKTYLL